MKTFLKLIIISFALFSCVERDFDVPNLDEACNNLTVTKSVADIYNLATTSPILYTADDVIEGYVTSSDNGGNFFKSISFVSTDGLLGFSVPVDQVTLFANYQPGRKVFVKLQNKYISKDHDGLVIGNENINPTYPSGLSRLFLSEYKNVLTIGCEKKNENEILLTGLTISQAVNNANLNKLIEFDNVQFKDEFVGKTYFDPTNTAGSATNNEIIGINGNSVIVRVSEYASFKGQIIPGNSGKIRGVLTKFNGTFQFMIRDIEDVQLTNDRFTIDLTPPLGGTAITYNGSFSENFESYPTGSASEAFPKYINDPVIGTRYWRVTEYGGNKYIQLSSFGGTAEANRSLFIVPVDFTSANTLSFKSKAGYANGPVLKVYYSTNYLPLSNVNNATLVDITSSFTISPGLSSGYPTTFASSGNWNIPASLTGNGFIIYEYIGNGNGGPTTTMQIDDIVVN